MSNHPFPQMKRGMVKTTLRRSSTVVEEECWRCDGKGVAETLTEFTCPFCKAHNVNRDHVFTEHSKEDTADFIKAVSYDDCEVCLGTGYITRATL